MPTSVLVKRKIYSEIKIGNKIKKSLNIILVYKMK